jgi:hypothetical protein
MPGWKGPEATQEIDASDVLEVIAIDREEARSFPSLVPVGIEVGPERRDDSIRLRLAARRRELSRYVIGAVAVSCAILVASVVKREVVPKAEAVSVATPHAAVVAPSALPTPRAPAPQPPPVNASGPVAAAVPVPDAPTTGSGGIRFAPPAKAGWVWLDGKRLTATSAIVTCGTHQVKVGYSPRHAVVVPCGGEVVLSR